MPKLRPRTALNRRSIVTIKVQDNPFARRPHTTSTPDIPDVEYPGTDEDEDAKSLLKRQMQEFKYEEMEREAEDLLDTVEDTARSIARGVAKCDKGARRPAGVADITHEMQVIGSGDSLPGSLGYRTTGNITLGFTRDGESSVMFLTVIAGDESSGQVESRIEFSDQATEQLVNYLGQVGSTISRNTEE